MEIKITPKDLVERFIWDKYVYYVLDVNATKENKSFKTETEKLELLELNEEFIISEQDAFVIGLTNVIYTPNVIYKFKQYLLDVLNNRNFEVDHRLHINRQLLLDNVAAFKHKIPTNFTSSDIEFNIELNKLDLIYIEFVENVNNLITVNVQEWPCVKCGQVKKLINKIS